MIIKFLEAFFRHKLLILLPALLIPGIVAPIAILTAPMYYETFASIWVEKPTYISYASDWNQYISPAQNQSGRLGELLRTRTFMLDVAKRTALAPLLGSPQGEAQVVRFLGTGAAQWTNGDHLLMLRFRAASPDLSFQVVNAIVDSFKERAAADRVAQGRLATSFYSERLKQQQDQLNTSTEALQRFIAANPRVASLLTPENAPAISSTASRAGLPLIASDPQLAQLLDLQRQVDANQKDVDRLQQIIEGAELDVSAGLQGQTLGFQVADPPQMPTTATRERKKTLIYPVAGLLAGVGISATLLVLLVAGDRSVRSAADLATTASVVGSLPRLRLKRLPRRAGADTYRRALAFPAGTTLPQLPMLPAVPSSPAWRGART